MKCPGQDTQYWKPDAIFEVRCPECNHTVEFFKDDTARRCHHCGHRFVNPNMDFGCAAYCQYAEQCLGTLPEELLAQKEDLLKDRVAVAMKRFLKNDFKRISHAGRTARYAERIARQEQAALPVVLCAAYLRGIGAPAAMEKHGSAALQHLAAEGPDIARSLLTGLKAREELIAAVCEIIGTIRPPAADSAVELKVVFDADRIAALEEAQKTEPRDPRELVQIIDTELATAAGKTEARRVLLKEVKP
jgi:hypothetical protein